MDSDESPAIPEVLTDLGEQRDDAPIAFGAHLGGVGSVMLIAWHELEHRFVTVALRVLERTQRGRLIFELPDSEWLVLLEREYESIMLTAQVGDRFVTVEGKVELVHGGPSPRVVVAPSSQTFWDTISRRVARVASNASAGRRHLSAETTP